MKISLNWIKEFTDIKCSEEELISKIGAQIGEIDEVMHLGERYKGVVVAKVVECKRHPDADKLSVCKIDDGGATTGVKRDSNGYAQVVCGAPNVRSGLHVAWIPPGAIVPSTYDKEQFKLDVRPLRGVDSNGMLASGHELAINNDQSGLLIVDKPATLGTSFADLYKLDDTIVDIENKMFTHRPDCFGILGVAREIAGIQNIKFVSPDWYAKDLRLKVGNGNKLKLDVQNEITELVPRYMAVAMSGVKVTKSPIAIQSYLSRVGVSPVNNVVDMTNFVMMLTAQPLHAFDYDKVAAQDGSDQATVVVRKPKSGEQIALLNGKTVKPRKDALMIASKKRLLAVGGVIGGADTEVDENTKNIILECANFDMYSIRRTSMEHGLFTDAVTRFNKGQSPLQTERVLTYTMAWLQKIAGGQIASKVHDIKHSAFKQKSIETTTQFINARLGLKLNGQEIAKRLGNVEFEVREKAQELSVKPPFWRTDIHIPEDIVEEVGRLVGYDSLPLQLPRRSITPAAEDSLMGLKAKIRTILSGAGANEVFAYSFVHGNLLDKSGQDKAQAFELSNALSPDLQYYRLSITPSLLDKIHSNIKANYDEFAIFELGKTHDKAAKDHNEPKVPHEHERMALVYGAKTPSVGGAAYYQAKKLMSYLLDELNIQVEIKPLHHDYSDSSANFKAWVAPYEPKRSALVLVRPKGQEHESAVLGVVGEYRGSVSQSLKLPRACAGFELDTRLLQVCSTSRTYKPLLRFPKTQQDISFSVKTTVKYAQLYQVIYDELSRARQEHGYEFELGAVDIYQPDHDRQSKHLTYRIHLSHPHRTLTTQEANDLLENIAQAAKDKLKADRL